MTQDDRIFLLRGLIARRGVPDPGGGVEPGGSQLGSLGAEGHAPDAILVAAETQHLPAGLRVPEFDLPLLPGSGESPSVRAIGEVADAVVESLEAADDAGGRR